MRLFFAINFSEETKSNLASLRDELRVKSARGNFSAAENMHLTLAFLGECNAKQSAAAKAVIDLLNIEEMNIYVDRLGCFRRNDGDIWWAGIADNARLFAMQHDLTEKLISARFQMENRKYNPHITLARKVVTKEQPRQVEPFGETIRSVELMKSERLQGKLTYTIVHMKKIGYSAKNIG